MSTSEIEAKGLGQRFVLDITESSNDFKELCIRVYHLEDKPTVKKKTFGIRSANLNRNYYPSNQNL